MHIVSIMRTTIVIDDILMKEVLEKTGIKTKREAVQEGLKILLERADQAAQIRALRGKVEFFSDEPEKGQD